MPGREEVFDLNDVSDLTMLASYAATAQVCFLSSDLMKPAVRHMTQNQIAQRWRKVFPPRGTDPSEDLSPQEQKTRDNTATGLFSRKLKKPTATFLRQVDHILLRRAPQLLRAGGLASFHARLHGVRTLDNVESSVSLLYTSPLLLEKADEAIVVLIQASALLAKFEDDDHVRFGMEAEDKQALSRVVNGLILIGGLPPTPYSVDALLFLGSLSRFAFNEVKTELEKALRKPLGFRTWRAITAVVAAIKDAKETTTVSGNSVRQWVKNQLEACERLREHSLYPARSLDLELAIVIPKEWSNPATGDWAGDVLRGRARDRSATLRERGTAAFGLWERAITSGDPAWIAGAEAELQQITAQFLAENDERPGAAWVAKVLRENIHRRRAILTDWPDLGDPAQRIVKEALEELHEVPHRIRAATGKLLEHAILKNAGVYRRRAIETLRAGGFAEQAARAVAVVVRNAETQSWLKVRALFTLGFLQDREATVQGVLGEACATAWNKLKGMDRDDSQAFRVLVIELHTAIFAIGDCFGDPAASDEADTVRRSIDDLLEELIREVAADKQGYLTPIGRAIAYLVGSTAHVNVAASRRLLEEIVELDDEVTKALGEWGKARLGPTDDDPVRPAHDVEFRRLRINV